MKAHIGVDSRTKLIHTVLASAANVADVHALPHLLHGDETRVWGDQAHRGLAKNLHRLEVTAAAGQLVYGATPIVEGVGELPVKRGERA